MNRRYNDIFGVDGVFTFLHGYNPPWIQKASAPTLNFAYAVHSGEKILNNHVDNTFGDPIRGWAYNDIASFIWGRYGLKWTSLYNTFLLEYNPIENYRMTERETIDNSHNGTHNDTTNTTINGTTTNTETATHTGTDTTENTVSTAETGTSGDTVSTGDITTTKTGTTATETQGDNTTTGDTTYKTFGFNSADPVNRDKDIVTNNQCVDNTETRTDNLQEVQSKSLRDTTTIDKETTTANDTTITKNLTDGLNGTVTETNTNEQTNSGTTADTTETVRQLERYGNVGVTTSQQMIQSERDLWLWDFFETVVFKDLDNLLCLSMYD